MKKKIATLLTTEQIYEWKKETVDYLQSLYPKLPSPMRDQLMAEGILQALHMFKGEFLLKPGRPADKAYYLRKGLVKLYYYDEDDAGALKLLYIWEPESIVVIFNKFKEGIPNVKYYMELMQDSELVSISNFSMEDIYEEHTAAYELTNKILWMKTQRRELQTSILQMTDKKQRYCRFKVLFPGLFLNGRCLLSNEEICAFLNISGTILRESRNEMGESR